MVRVKGYVHRYGQEEVTIQFTQNIPYRFIVKEQIHRRNQKFSEEDLLGANPR
jgi:hypothetical protein